VILVRIAAALLVLACGGCEREARRFDDSPPPARPVTMSELGPGPRTMASTMRNPYEGNAWAISQGKRLFSQFNCVGCHGQGGGAIGPPLMDDEWIYGSEPENVFATIAQGRPNGMPAFGGKLNSQQIWQLVGYVQSLGGLIRKDVAPGRDDHMQRKAQEQSTDKMEPASSGIPASAEGRQ